MVFHGWKYFNVKNFNELFSMMVEQYGTVEVDSDDDEDPFAQIISPKKSQRSIISK